MLKNVLVAVLCGIVGFGAAVYFIKRPTPIIKTIAQVAASPTPTPTPIPFDSEVPPTDSLKGSLTFTGRLNWESRTATESAEIFESRLIQQGESLETQENGQATIKFQDIGTIKMSPETKVDVIQTLPINLVFRQPTGTATYAREGNSLFSIRSLHLLINQEIGEITVSIDKVQPVITIKVLKGSITVAYNDKNTVSQVMTIPQGKTLTFNDTKRTIKIR